MLFCDAVRVLVRELCNLPCLGSIMVVVGKHFTFLLIVV